MTKGKKGKPHADIRIMVYRTITQLLLVALIAGILKYAVCETAPVETNQMAPAILNGDRVILSKLKYTRPFSLLLRPRLREPVIFRHPLLPYESGCLRIAGTPGDTLRIHDGVFSIVNKPAVTFVNQAPKDNVLPMDYSPRDNMPFLVLPKAGENIAVDRAAIRDCIFLYAMIAQENPRNNYSLVPQLHIDDSLTSDYFIEDFSLYTGTFNAIPESLYTNWFFWDRLHAYLISANTGKKTALTFSILEGESAIPGYTVKNDFYFLLSDNWIAGYDSRYFGPVVATALKGKVVGVLWSLTPRQSGVRALRMRRIFKIL